MSSKHPIGTYLLFRKRPHNGAPQRMVVGQIFGYDMYGSKYNYNLRISGWGEYYWGDGGGWWAFESDVVAKLTEEQAQAQLVEKDDGRVLLFEMDWKPGGTGGGKVWKLIDGVFVAQETHASYQAACDAYGERGWKDYL